MNDHPETTYGHTAAVAGNNAGKGKKTRIRRVTLALGSAIALAFTMHGIAFAGPPPPLPASADELDKKFQPAMDYDTDGCYPTPAIGPEGYVNGGLEPSGSLSGDCHETSDLDTANMYSRSKCNNGWCAVAYALYFEKDQVVTGADTFGHRHDWEHAVVWVQDDQAKFVAASRQRGFSIRPSNEILFDDNTHVKIVYHKDGPSSHALRYGGASDEPPDNDHGKWHYPGLVGWEHFPRAPVSIDTCVPKFKGVPIKGPGIKCKTPKIEEKLIRDILNEAEFGKAILRIKDRYGSFNDLLADAKPAGVSFDPYAANEAR